MTGLSRGLKEGIPGCKVIAVDPVGSILAVPASLNTNIGEPNQVEGIGYDFIPTVLDQEGGPDHWVKAEDAEAFQMARTIIRREGIMCGGSSGSTMCGALKAIKELNITKGRVCVLFADSTRNYMSKFLDDDWMRELGFPLDIL
jgi:cystathionine beta-synthase